MATTVYITKYALTAGIKTEKTDSDTSELMIGVKMPSGYCVYFHVNDWHTDPKDAIARAETMRLRKINSLKRSLAQMEALRFNLTAART